MKHYTKYFNGVFSPHEAKRLRDIYKAFYGQEVLVKLRGRGKRVIIISGMKCRFMRDLPIKYAEKIAVYTFWKSINTGEIIYE